MSSFYGVEYTNVTQDVPSEKAPGNKWGGRVRCMFDTYELAAAKSQGDKIYMGKLRKGDRVIGVTLAFDALDASGGTVDVGYEYNATGESSLTDDPDAFIDGAACDAAGIVAMNEAALVDGFGYEVEGDADLVVTVATDWDATSGTIKLCVLYARE